MDILTVGLKDRDGASINLVGGKGAHLAALSRMSGIRVPDGFCITTEAFQRMINGIPRTQSLLDELAQVQPADRSRVAALSAALREVIEAAALPPAIADAIIGQLNRYGATAAYAIRSSATAEDLPAASFAGQQDTYLNITGQGAVLEQVKRCWASLYTERAVSYRMQQGFDHRNVRLAVVVQHMVLSEASGILFTADPLTGNRKVSAIDAGFGLGEALVSGIVNADHYQVCDGKVIERKTAAKTQAVYASAGGGTGVKELEAGQQHRPVLTDEQILRLAQTGRIIEAHFGSPQDIEWCLADDLFYIVQSRPVTTLYPIPVAGDADNHVYVSVGHQQMMTDAMKPLGLSLRQLTNVRPLYEAGGRLFVDVAADLASPARRHLLVNVLGKSDPLIRDALTTILDREGFIPTLPEERSIPHSGKPQGPPPAHFETLQDYDPAVVGELISRSEAAMALLQHDIQVHSGTGLVDFILEDIRALHKSLSDPQSFGVVMTSMNAYTWINDHMQEWLGEKNAADMLTQSVPHNITSEMGLALLDVADAIRPYPEVITYLQTAPNDGLLEGLTRLPGGPEARKAIDGFLAVHGMRCAGEIDITRARWSEQPALLVPTILNNIHGQAPGASRRRWTQGLQEAIQKEQELLERLSHLPDGAAKARETKRMIGLVRSLAGYREYPKYEIVSRYFCYKQALLKEVAQLVAAGVFEDPEDSYYLTLEELREAIRTRRADQELIGRRRADFRHYEKLTPPRVMTSDGEVLNGSYHRTGLPAGAIAGLAVSAGVAEGRARVLRKMEDANLEEGDILVTTFTDPSWTPLFVSIKGLVTEVGGLMTHGAVIAREYGLPAVVGVDGATQRIRDGQLIRVHGTEGFIEILDA